MENDREKLPYISHIGMCHPQRVRFLRRFGLKRGIDFAHIGLESGLVNEGTTVVYQGVRRCNSKGIKERKCSMNSKFAAVLISAMTT